MSHNNSSLRSINGFLIIIVLIQLTSCAGSARFSEDQLIIEMEKTPCYGFCPVYTIKIDQAGHGIFKGAENTDQVGLFSFRLKKKEITDLHFAFEQTGFFELKDRYHERVSDLPTTFLSYRIDGREKKIMDYYGAPPELKNLEKQIEALVLSKKMQKTE